MRFFTSRVDAVRGPIRPRNLTSVRERPLPAEVKRRVAREHPIPRKATMAERVNWHIAHAKACACREIPRTILNEPLFVTLARLVLSSERRLRWDPCSAAANTLPAKDLTGASNVRVWVFSGKLAPRAGLDAIRGEAKPRRDATEDRPRATRLTPAARLPERAKHLSRRGRS